ncbi:DUF502 domain-containing protein [Salinibaculum rarum]|uniref:DUF502 domain-containing protein n=1 Tax=Salinibaculum rarum TaxID=3058903 RepID=UPI00265E7F9A|nr:DUF502 domain-containing protein [Salinibaculum sp. KK48]
MVRISKEYPESAVDTGGFLRRTIVTGTAIVLPVLITAFVFLVLIDLLSGVLNPLVIPIQEGIGATSSLIPQVIAMVVLLVTIFVVGGVTESRVGGNRIKQRLDSTMARIPGISTVYGPLDQISSMLLEGDTENFQEVVLVEFPKEGSYSIAFQTSHPPSQVTAATGDEDMLTVFMPMGPNPFMGGFILHLSQEEVYDLDLSVKEGISSIVSFGVAVEIDDHSEDIPIDLDGLQSDEA